MLAEVAATDTQFPARTCGGLVTVAVAGLYSIGLGRAWGLDAAVTVHNFIVTPSLFDPFRRQLVYNNHVLFSFVDHLVYSLTGSADERVLRVVPILASALSAGVLADAVARRAGALAAFAAAARSAQVRRRRATMPAVSGIASSTTVSGVPPSSCPASGNGNCG